MAFFTLEEAVIKQFRNDPSITSFLGKDFSKKIFEAFVRPQLFQSGNLLLPNISIDINYGAEEPALPAMNGICTITMDFEELKPDGTPTRYSDMSLLKEHIMDAVHKIDFSAMGITMNHFNLLSGSEPFFILEDKIWKWPLIFEFVHENQITIGRVGVFVGAFTDEYTEEFD